MKGLMTIEPTDEETLSAFISRFEAYRAQLAGDETMKILARECLINAFKAQFGDLLKSVVMMDGFQIDW
jgi:hypothetical protein